MDIFYGTLCIHFFQCLIQSILISVLWRKLIVKHNGIVGTNLDISSLAKISDGYTMGHINTACEQVRFYRNQYFISWLNDRQAKSE